MYAVMCCLGLFVGADSWLDPKMDIRLHLSVNQADGNLKGRMDTAGARGGRGITKLPTSQAQPLPFGVVSLGHP